MPEFAAIAWIPCKDCRIPPNFACCSCWPLPARRALRIPTWISIPVNRWFPAGPEGILDTEKLGGLKLGMPDGEVVKMLGPPGKSTKAILMEATGEWLIDRSWPDKGLSLGMFAGKEAGPWVLGSISAKAPCRLATAKGIRVGSFEADVAKAYAKEHSADDSVAGQCFVAGSIYGGVIFDLKEGVVTRIFMGAAAE